MLNETKGDHQPIKTHRMKIDNDGLKTETYGTENRHSLGRRNKQTRSREQNQANKEQRTKTIWGKAYTEQRTEAIRGKSFAAEP